MAGRPWAPDEIDLVLHCYEFTPTRELAELLDRTIHSIYRLAGKLDLRKDVSVIREEARRCSSRPDHPFRQSQFPKGHVPANKGKKSPGVSYGRMRETQFKKGESLNKMPIGAKRRIDGYWYRKVSDVPYVAYSVNWKPVHHLLWEKKRAPVPRGHTLVLKDGNVDNIKLSNLELITRAELMRRNTVHNLPKNLVQVIMLNGALKRKIRRRLRDAEKQDERPEKPPVRNTRKAA
jgi:hypothetical protein